MDSTGRLDTSADMSQQEQVALRSRLDKLEQGQREYEAMITTEILSLQQDVSGLASELKRLVDLITEATEDVASSAASAGGDQAVVEAYLGA